MNKFRFLEWKVYKDSKQLLSQVLDVAKKLPKEYRYELGTQAIRSAFSTSLNIAEGSGKSSDKDMNKYFDIAWDHYMKPCQPQMCFMGMVL